MTEKMGVTFCGKHYEIDLEQSFAGFVKTHLAESGVDFRLDNRPEALLKAYLRMAKAVYEHETKVSELVLGIERTLSET